MDRVNLPALFFFNIVLAILGLLPLYTNFRIYFDIHKIAFLDFGWDYIKSNSIITTGGDCIHEIKRHSLLGRKAMTNLDSILKSRHHFVDKGLYSQSYGFSRSHVWMWELDHKEGWALMNWCFWAVVPEKTLETSLNSKTIKAVHPKGNKPWIFIGRTGAVAEAPILWPTNVKNRLI